MSWRKIEVEGIAWQFRLGKMAAVIRYRDDSVNIQYVVKYDELTGRSWDVLERGQAKKTSDGMVTPGHVRSHLLKNRDDWKHLVKV